MGAIRFTKVVSTLPSILQPNTMYLVRKGAGFDLYCSDMTGSIAHKINGLDYSGGGAPPEFLEEFRRFKLRQFHQFGF